MDTLSLVRQLIPLGWEHPKIEILKTKKFYEFISVDTDSILVTHMPCSQDPNRIGYSKVVIKQILTPSQWKAQPCINKTDPHKPGIGSLYSKIIFTDILGFCVLICIERT